MKYNRILWTKTELQSSITSGLYLLMMCTFHLHLKYLSICKCGRCMYIFSGFFLTLMQYSENDFFLEPDVLR